MTLRSGRTLLFLLLLITLTRFFQSEPTRFFQSDHSAIISHRDTCMVSALRMRSRLDKDFKFKTKETCAYFGLLLLVGGDIELNPGPVTSAEVTMPPAKKARIRRYPCPCSMCMGAERDHRTIERHLQALGELTCEGHPPSISESDQVEDGSFSSPIVEDGSFSSPIVEDGSFSSPIVEDGSFSSPIDEDGSRSSPIDEDGSRSSPIDKDGSRSPPIDKDGSRSTGDVTTSVVLSSKDITRYIFEEALVKLEGGSSQKVTEQHLENTRRLLGISDSNIIPSGWNGVVQLMRKHGYCPPIHYKVCCEKDHSMLLRSEVLDPECSFCGKPWSLCIDYYVVGLKFKDWFQTEDQCENLMEHWQDRHSWLDIPPGYVHPEKSELWHGSKYKEHSYFWDSSKRTLLPAKCVSCSSIIPSSQIQEALQRSDSEDITQLQLVCDACTSSLSIVPRYMQGDPRNQAILIHYDGWSPHSTSSSHSIAAITITHGCMNKFNRSSSNNARVYSFVPVAQLPKDSPHKYDAFLEPLINDIAKLYIEGEKVFFKARVEGHSPSNDTAVLRILPVLLTADLKAHAEVGLTLAGGLNGCRRCHMTGEYVSERNHYYYGNFLYRYRFPCEMRSAGSNRELAKKVDSAATVSERKRLAKFSGVTGETILYRLYDLCNFDPIKDLVVDVMHSLVLNLIRSELENHLLADLGANASVPPKDRCRTQGGLLDRKDLFTELRKVQWTAELKDGRLPRILESEPRSSHKLGNWKAEEFSKFITVAPYLLRELIPKKAYECFCVLSSIHKLIYSMELRVHGWTSEEENCLKCLLWKHHIMYESLYGLSACSENVEYSLHMVEDVARHSSPDNYWCYMYERMVSYYKKQTTNKRLLCKTFADRAAQLHFVKKIVGSFEKTSNNATWKMCEVQLAPVLLKAKSMEQAISLKDFLSTEDLPSEVKRQYECGIMLGSPYFITLSERQLQDVKYWLSKFNHTLHNPTHVARTFKRIFKTNVYDLAITYRIGDHIVLADSEFEREWVMTVTNFIVYGPVENKYHLFVDGDYMVATDERDDWTGEQWLVKRSFERLRMQPMSLIKRKVMLHQHATQEKYLTIDYDGPCVIETPSVPFHPLEGEVVQTIDDTLVYVEQIDRNAYKAKGKVLRKVLRSPRWKLSNDTEISLFDIVKCVTFQRNCGYFLFHT